MHEDERVVVGGYAEDVAVFAFEGGAGDYDAGGGGGEGVDGLGAEEDEPVPSVGVG